jgi:hypothetical protein
MASTGYSFGNALRRVNGGVFDWGPWEPAWFDALCLKCDMWQLAGGRHHGDPYRQELRVPRQGIELTEWEELVVEQGIEVIASNPHGNVRICFCTASATFSLIHGRKPDERAKAKRPARGRSNKKKLQNATVYLKAGCFPQEASARADLSIPNFWKAFGHGSQATTGIYRDLFTAAMAHLIEPVGPEQSAKSFGGSASGGKRVPGGNALKEEEKDHRVDTSPENSAPAAAEPRASRARPAVSTRKMGRKLLLNRELADRIVTLLNSGKSMQETADIVGVSLRSLRSWARIGDHQNEVRIAVAVDASKRRRGLGASPADSDPLDASLTAKPSSTPRRHCMTVPNRWKTLSLESKT